MKRLVGICLTAIFLMPAGSTAACAASFRPAWQVGDGWRVEVVQRLPAGANDWSAPVTWEYRVTAVDTWEGDQVYVVDVSPASGSGGRGARLWYRCADLSLAALEVRMSSEQVVTKRVFDTAIPVSTERSFVPFDAPLFPVDPPSLGEYRVKRAIGGGFVKHVVLQQEANRFSGQIEYCPSVAGDDLIEILCTRDGEELFVQYWVEGCPWPVCGENRDLRYRLVRE